MASDPNVPSTQVFASRAEVAERLAPMDLSAPEFIAVARQAEAHVRETTLNDPQSFPGTVRWAKLNRGFLESAGPRGWGRANPRNMPIALKPDGTMAIAVVAGSAATGYVDGTPATRYPRGPATRLFVPPAQRSFADISEDFAALTTRDAPVLWFLLHHWNKATDTLGLEFFPPGCHKR